MLYEEVHREIVNDFRDLYSAIMKEYTGFQKTAKKAKRYPYRKKYQWTHPVSHNQFTYFFETKRLRYGLLYSLYNNGWNGKTVC